VILAPRLDAGKVGCGASRFQARRLFDVDDARGPTETEVLGLPAPVPLEGESPHRFVAMLEAWVIGSESSSTTARPTP
jgi:hypothetical protein